MKKSAMPNSVWRQTQEKFGLLFLVWDLGEKNPRYIRRMQWTLTTSWLNPNRIQSSFAKFYLSFILAQPQELLMPEVVCQMLPPLSCVPAHETPRARTTDPEIATPPLPCSRWSLAHISGPSESVLKPSRRPVNIYFRFSPENKVLFNGFLEVAEPLQRAPGYHVWPA